MNSTDAHIEAERKRLAGMEVDYLRAKTLVESAEWPKRKAETLERLMELVVTARADTAVLALGQMREAIRPIVLAKEPIKQFEALKAQIAEMAGIPQTTNRPPE